MHLKTITTKTIDAMLEASIVGSFTKIGYGTRAALNDWASDPSDLSGQIAVITGATSGIGRATAKALIAMGAEVHITSRDQDRADEVAAELTAAGPGRAVGHSLDTGDFASICSFADELTSGAASIDILIHNAGALSSEFRTDERGTELTLSTHLIGPYLLTRKLQESLSAGARVLWMSSGGMYTQKLDVDSIELDEDNYSGAQAYAKAKRGQVELVAHLGPKWAPAVTMHAVHPGWVDTPGVDAGLPGFGKVMGPLLRSPDQGADTMVWLAATGAGHEPAGQFWHDRTPRGIVYLPGTGTDDDERQQLVDWLDEQIRPAIDGVAVG